MTPQANLLPPLHLPRQGSRHRGKVVKMITTYGAGIGNAQGCFREVGEIASCGLTAYTILII